MQGTRSLQEASGPVSPDAPASTFWRHATVLAAVCAIPAILVVLGAGFSTHGVGIDPSAAAHLSPDELHEAAFLALRGTFTHTVLEWTALCIAAAVGLAAFFQFRLTGDRSLLVIGVAIVCAGAMDGFHAFTANRLTPSVADHRELVPFTWAICRVFNAVILLVGVGLFALSGRVKSARWSSKVLVAITSTFVLCASGMVVFSATSTELPQAMFPDAWIKRPYDLLPMVPYAICAAFVFPAYARRHPSPFAYALCLSLVPQIAAQLYTAFGSFTLHDTAFNVAHALKALGYLIPGLGLVQQTARAFRAEESLALRLTSQAEELARAKDQADAASKAKSEFVASMSHEVRTSMNGLLGFAENLMDSALSEARREEAIEVIRGTSTHLLQIIDDVLDLSKIEAGRLGVERLPVSPIGVVNDVVAHHGHEAKSKGIDLSVEVRGQGVPRKIQTDPTRLRQILMNLVGNALKFTPEGGVRVVLEFVAGDDARLMFSVIDSGVGMTPEQVERVFEPFVQSNTSTARTFGGTGLGIPLSERLAQLLGGSITAFCEPGEGCTFQVDIPVGRARVELVRNADAEVERLRERSATTPAEGERLDGMNVLLVEDDPVNQKLMARVLEMLGAEVVAADDGLVALDEVERSERESQPFDIILMDMQMPRMDGHEATRELRGRGCDLPIVAVTAGVMDLDRERCIEEGFSEIVMKPIQRKELVEVLRRLAPAASERKAG